MNFFPIPTATPAAIPASAPTGKAASSPETVEAAFAKALEMAGAAQAASSSVEVAPAPKPLTPLRDIGSQLALASIEQVDAAPMANLPPGLPAPAIQANAEQPEVSAEQPSVTTRSGESLSPTLDFAHFARPEDAGQPPAALAEIRERMDLIEHAGQIPIDTSVVAQSGLTVATHLAVVAPVPPAPISPRHDPLTTSRTVEHLDKGQHAAQLSAQTAAALAGANSGMDGRPFDASMSEPALLSPESGNVTGHDLPSSTALRLEGNGLAMPSSIAPQSASIPVATLAAPVGSQEWRSDLGHQLIGMHLRGEQQVELHLHPADLGPLSVSLKVTEAGAQVHFLSAHQAVRVAVEGAIPQLRDALADQGISLNQTSVGEHRQQQAQDQQFGQQSTGGGLTETAPQAETEEPGRIVTTTLRNLSGRIDVYA